MCCVMWTPQSNLPQNTHPQTDTQSWAAAQMCPEQFGGVSICLMYVRPLGFSALSFLM